MSPSKGIQQPSLDNFFKRRDPPTSSVAKSESPSVIDLTTSPPSKKAKLNDSPRPPKPMTQMSSGYFNTPSGSKPGINEAARPLAKQLSQSIQSYRLPKLTRTQRPPSGSAFDAYSFETQPSFIPDSQPEIESTQASQRTEVQLERHGRWQEKVTAMGGLFRRRKSLALEEAAVAEARKAAGLNTPGEDGTPIGDRDEPGLDDDDEEVRISEEVGKKLQKYAAKDHDARGKKGRGKLKKKVDVGPSGLAYTPLEKQFMEIKEINQDVLLMMEVGYKYKFLGDDAKIAAQELGIVAFPSRNFFTASIPVHRLHIHVKKLISLGHKVGVISQTETAALKKAGDNKSAPFTRKLTHLYTAATYVDESSHLTTSTRHEGPSLYGSGPPPTNALLAVVEEDFGGLGADGKVKLGLVSVIPETGEVTWDEFEDSRVRTELETRLTHLAPSELLLPQEMLSKPSEKVLDHFAGPRAAGSQTIRRERIESTPSYNAALDFLTEFYRNKSTTSENDDEEFDATLNEEDIAHLQNNDEIRLATGLHPGNEILALVDFPKQIVVALAVIVQYMKRFGLENAFRHRTSFVKFVNRSHMLLSSNTLANLEIYQNQTDGGLYGSLMWLLDHCKTRMGRRLLREWIGRPLLDVSALRARSDAIEEIMESNTYHTEKLRSLLVNMPDLVKGLTRVQYGKAIPTEVATILVSLVRLASEFKPGIGDCFRSTLLSNIPKTLPTILEASQTFLSALNIKAARENDQANMWTDPDKYPDIQDVKDCISVCEMELLEHLHEVRKAIRKPSLQYITVSGIEYLVEVPIRDAKLVPPRWVKISATRSVTRYHTPEIIKVTREREQHKERLAQVSREAFASFQSDIAQCHNLTVVSKQIAVIDCLMSLAQVAASAGYCKPEFVAEPVLKIRAGRHPMVEMLREEAYVPFDVNFSEDDGTAKVITGPNMAGKSSAVRAMALIVCLAQIGSFVPATSVILGVHDAVQTRMGASDEIGRGKSTFMVELSETSDILRTVTPRSLVILDELGRGTSTYDGVAIAYATLSHIAGVGCNTLFVTHYPMVAEDLARERPKQISNWHMGFEEVKYADRSAEITFLYQLKRGLAEASFGVWCARLAGLPGDVLEKAQIRSDLLKSETQLRLKGALARRTRRMFSELKEGCSATPAEVLNNVNLLQKALYVTASV